MSGQYFYSFFDWAYIIIIIFFFTFSSLSNDHKRGYICIPSGADTHMMTPLCAGKPVKKLSKASQSLIGINIPPNNESAIIIFNQ